MKLNVWLILILGGLATLGPLGTDLYLVALPTMADDFGVPGTTIQLTLSAFTIGMALGQLVIGAISDRLGRRRILLMGLAIMMFAGGFAAISPTAPALIVACAFMGTAAATGLVSGRAVVSDLATGHAATRAFSFLGLVTGIGPMMGPILGVIFLTNWGWRSMFAFLAIYAATWFLLVLLFVGESLPPEKRQRKSLSQMLRNYPDMFLDAVFRYHALVFWCVFGTIFAWIATSSFLILSILHQPVEMFSLAFLATSGTAFVTGMLSTYLAKWVRARSLIRAGLTFMSIGALLLTFLVFSGNTTYWLYLIALILVVGNFGFIAGPSNAMALTYQRYRGGTAFSVMGFVQWGTGGVVSAIIASSGSDSAIPFAVAAFTGTALAILFFNLGRKPAAAIDA
jgi:DHA1 family bicyclomycin/chloramphenicol resistance-like MFS transporter